MTEAVRPFSRVTERSIAYKEGRISRKEQRKEEYQSRKEGRTDIKEERTDGRKDLLPRQHCRPYEVMPKP